MHYQGRNCGYKAIVGNLIVRGTAQPKAAKEEGGVKLVQTVLDCVRLLFSHAVPGGGVRPSTEAGEWECRSRFGADRRWCGAGRHGQRGQSGLCPVPNALRLGKRGMSQSGQ